MTRNSFLKRITGVASVIVGFLFCFLMSSTTREHHIQNGLLGFIIGFPIVWIIYLSIWFIIRGISKTPFLAQANFIINGLKRILNTTFTVYQEKMLVEITGTVLLIAAALALAGAAFFIVTGVLFIVGRLAW